MQLRRRGKVIPSSANRHEAASVIASESPAAGLESRQGQHRNEWFDWIAEQMDDPIHAELSPREWGRLAG